MSTASYTINNDPAQYQSLGYCIRPELVDMATISKARSSLDQMITALDEGERPESLVEPHVLADDWQFWLELCRDERVLDAVQQCMQCDEVTLLMSHLIVKPAGDGLKTHWHQDNTYWPSVDGTDVTTVWLALDNVDTENAAMWVIPDTPVSYTHLTLPTNREV